MTSVNSRKPMKPEHKKAISGSLKGRKFTLEHRLKISIALTGKKHPELSERNKTYRMRCQVAKSKIGKPRPESVRIAVSKAQKGKKYSTEEREKRRLWCYENNWRPPVNRGSDSPSWKGGITPINEKIRSSQEYKEWRFEVFKRDSFECVWCGDNKGGNLNADHIKEFAKYPELRLEVSNGRTLCEPCHQIRHSASRTQAIFHP